MILTMYRNPIISLMFQDITFSVILFLFYYFPAQIHFLLSINILIIFYEYLALFLATAFCFLESQ